MILTNRNRICLFTIVYLLYAGILNAQKSDSLIVVLKSSKEDTNKVVLLIKIAFNYLYTEPTKGEAYLKQSMSLSRKLNYPIGEAKSYFFTGVINSRIGKTEEAETNYKKALTIFDSIKNAEGLSGTLKQMASLYIAKEQYDKALAYQFKALELSEEIKDTASVAATLGSIAIVYSKIRQFDDAEKYFNKALLIKHKRGDKRGESIIYTNLGSMLVDEKKYDAALLNFNTALNLQNELNDSKIIVSCKENIANIFCIKRKYQEALSLYAECNEIYKKASDSIGMSRICSGIGSVELGRKNYTEAIQNYNKALELLKNFEDSESRRNAYVGLCESYIGAKEPDKAKEYIKKIFENYENTFSDDLSTKIAELKEKYEAEKREQDILLLEEQNKTSNALAEKQKLWMITISSFAMVLLMGLFLLFAYNRNRKKHKELEFVKIKAELEQTALRAQMNPHFIFNALNSIQHYILSEENKYAYDYLAKFSKLIRQILINSEKNTITLEKEIETLVLYIELEQRRFKNRFDFKINISNDVIPNEILIPTMLIQPFVENAIWHGIMNLDKNIKGKLNLDFNVSGKVLKICIEDNGIGRKEAALRKANNEYKSVGVLFSQRRLELLKLVTNQNAEVVIHDLTDDAEHALGTSVEIIIEMSA